MQCPDRKAALKKKKRERRQTKENSPSCVQAAEPLPSTTIPPIQWDPKLNSVILLNLFNAHLINTAMPGSYQETVSEGCRLNGLPNVIVPPNPPSRDIIRAILNVSPTTQQPSEPKPKCEAELEEVRLPTRDKTPPSPAPVSPSPGTSSQATPSSPSPTSSSPHIPEDNESGPEAKCDVIPYLVRARKDRWPAQRVYSSMKDGLDSGRYKLGYVGQPGSEAYVQDWIRRQPGSLAKYCYYAPDKLFPSLTNGLFASAAVSRLRPC